SRRRGALFGMEDAGRWALARRSSPRDTAQDASAAVEHLARVLLRRYGVVFWRLLERESGRLPPWRDFLRVYRRLEARGEVRGGRFVAGFSGEHFAMPEAIPLLRAARQQPEAESWITVCGADPLNLVGILTPGPRLAAVTGNRLLYRGGVPVALYAGGAVQFLETLDPAAEWQAKKILLRSPVPAGLAVLA
ncbi:MAG: Lhr family helicase, partial [Stellaceae bacterium]